MDRRCLNVFEKIKAARLQWAFLLSGVIHVVALVWCIYLWNQLPRPLPLVDIRLEEIPPEKNTEESKQKQGKLGTVGMSKRTAPSNRSTVARSKSASASSADQSSAGSSESRSPTDSSASGQAGFVTDPGGTAVGGMTAGNTGGVSQQEGATPGRGGGAGGGFAVGSGRGDLFSDYGPPAGMADPTVIAIPPTVRGSTASFEGAIYAEADRYVLHGPDLRAGIAVSGNELCVEGNMVRTIYRSKQTQRITNVAHCTSRNVGDDDVWICPKEADALAVVFDGYLAAPINYEINTCLVYDKSNCYHYLDGENQAEVCRQQRVKYEGIWAANTQFQYRCLKSEAEKFSHSLQYTVRFRQDVEIQGVGIVSLVIATETRKIAACR